MAARAVLGRTVAVRVPPEVGATAKAGAGDTEVGATVKAEAEEVEEGSTAEAAASVVGVALAAAALAAICTRAPRRQIHCT